MRQFGRRASSNERVRFLEPLGFFDFVALERDAFCVLSDSGTVQEECCLFRVPNVTIRDVTERPETIECGSNMLAGVDPDDGAALRACRHRRCRRPGRRRPSIWRPTCRATVAKIVLGYLWDGQPT